MFGLIDAAMCDILDSTILPVFLFVIVIDVVIVILFNKDQ